MPKSAAIMCWFGRSTFLRTSLNSEDFLNKCQEIRVGKSLKNNKNKSKEGKDDEETRQQKETRMETYMKVCHIQNIR